MRALQGLSFPLHVITLPKSGVFSTLSVTYWLTLVEKAVVFRGFSGTAVLEARPGKMALYHASLSTTGT